MAAMYGVYGAKLGRCIIVGMQEFIIRRALVQDVPSLVNLRSEMLISMGLDHTFQQQAWQSAAALWFEEAIANTRLAAVFVADHQLAGVVGCAVGSCDSHLPDPFNLLGLHGRVANMSTLPSFRGKGIGSACLEGLIEWFLNETQVTAVSLDSTAGAEPLYRHYGFKTPQYTVLQLELRDQRFEVRSRL